MAEQKRNMKKPIMVFSADTEPRIYSSLVEAARNEHVSVFRLRTALASETGIVSNTKPRLYVDIPLDEMVFNKVHRLGEEDTQNV